MVLNKKSVSRVIALLTEYQDNDLDYEEILSKYQTLTNSEECVSEDEAEVFLEIIRYENYLRRLLEVFYKSTKIQREEDMNINLVILYIICFQVPKMNDSDVKKLAFTIYPLKWKIMLRFLCQSKNLLLIAKSGLDILDFEFCRRNILDPLKFRSKWMKKLSDELQIKIRKIEIKEKAISKWPFSDKRLFKKTVYSRPDFNKRYEPCQEKSPINLEQKINTSKQDIENWNIQKQTKKVSIPIVIQPKLEDLNNYKEEMDILTKSLNELFPKEEECSVPKLEKDITQILVTPQSKEEENIFSVKDIEIGQGNDNILTKKEHDKVYNNKTTLNKSGIIQSLLKESDSVSNNQVQSTKYIPRKQNINNRVRYSRPKQSKAIVMLNTTAILREGAKVQQNEWQQLKRLQHLCNGGGDPTAVQRLEAKLKEQERREAKKAVEERHLRGLLWQEEALLAKQSVRQKNRDKASSVKAQKFITDALRRQLKEEEEKFLKHIVAKTQMIKINAQEAIKRNIETKQKQAKRMLEETKALKEAAAKKKEDDLSQKMELIKEIRVLHNNASQQNKKTYDFTETAGWGLSCEMSISELQERLLLAKLHLKEEIEMRKKIVKNQHMMKQKLLEDTKKYIADYKQSRAKISPTSKNSKVLEENESTEIEKLRKLLEMKRVERKRLMGQYD